jgi:hypothetical protein
MDSVGLADRLGRARRAVAEGETQIQHQRDLIVRLEEAGEDASDARALLTTMLKRQAERQNNLALVIRQFPQQG